MYTTDQEVKSIALAAFPDYKGKTFRVKVSSYPIDVRSYWDGGSRDYFNFVRLADKKVYGEIPQQSAFDKPLNGADSVDLIPGMVCVKHSYFCGKDTGITIYCHPENAPKLIEDTPELPRNELIVLYYTRSTKPSYAGIKNFRYHCANREQGIGLNEWNVAKESCIQKGLLNKAGAITNNGRNVMPFEKYGSMHKF